METVGDGGQKMTVGKDVKFRKRNKREKKRSNSFFGGGIAGGIYTRTTIPGSNLLL